MMSASQTGVINISKFRDTKILISKERRYSRALQKLHLPSLDD